MANTKVTQFIRASRKEVFDAFLNARAVQKWMVPDGMSSEVHEFEGREGGRFRISLTYTDAKGAGKTSAQTDTYHGRFTELVPEERIVQKSEFETDDPDMKGEMTATITLAEAKEGTRLTAVHSDLPPGLSPDDNETGWRMALKKFAELVETPT